MALSAADILANPSGAVDLFGPKPPSAGAAPLAKTVFSAGGKDVVATPDQMALSPVNPINELKPLSETDLADLINSTSPSVHTLGLFDRVKSTIGTALATGLSGSQARLNAVHNLTAILGGSRAALANVESTTFSGLLHAAGVPGNIAQRIGAGLAGTPGALSPKSIALYALGEEIPLAKIAINGVEHIRKLPDSQKAQGVIGLINALANEGTAGNVAYVLNYSAQLASVQAILKETMAYGVPALIDATIGGVVSPVDRSKILLECAYHAAQSGDAYTLSTAVQYCGGDAILKRYPNIISAYLANYKYPLGLTYPTASDANILVELLTSIDPNWHQYNRKGVWIPLLTNFAVCNGIAKSQLLLLPAHVTSVIIAPLYPVTTIVELTKRQYPKIAIPLN